MDQKIVCCGHRDDAMNVSLNLETDGNRLPIREGEHNRCVPDTVDVIEQTCGVYCVEQCAVQEYPFVVYRTITSPGSWILSPARAICLCSTSPNIVEILAVAHRSIGSGCSLQLGSFCKEVSEIAMYLDRPLPATTLLPRAAPTEG